VPYAARRVAGLVEDRAAGWAACLDLGERLVRCGQRRGGYDARGGEIDQRLALGGPVARGTGASQRPGPDGQRRGAAFLVELELQPNLIEHT
jgi:hypothetical protein